MDTGGLAQMTYNAFPSSGLGHPSSGFASRGRVNSKRLSVALPPKTNAINENHTDTPTPRTSKSHLLAGLRTAPRASGGPASAPYSQSQHMAQGYETDGNYNAYTQGIPQTAAGNYGNNVYAMNAGQQVYSLPEQVLAPPSFYAQEDEMDPNMLEQLQMTGLFLAQRQQQLQQQLANITAAANQFQGLNINNNVMRQQAHLQSPTTPMTPQSYAQQLPAPIEVSGQPGVYLVFNPATGQYQYAMDNSVAHQTPQRNFSAPSQTRTPLSKLSSSSSLYNIPTPTFRAEISPPPAEKATPINTRSITPPKTTPSPASKLEHVEPLPPPSANAFRRSHKKATSLAFSSSATTTPEAVKTSSPASFGSARPSMPPTPLSGSFGPGNARAGEHPVRQPRGPPSLDELVALPTSKHEGSKNFATRQRRRALDSLMRAGSVRRSIGHSSNSSPVSEGELSFNLSEEDEPIYGGIRKQSPIGSERVTPLANTKRGSQTGFDGFGTGSAVQTPACEEGNFFDMRSFVKTLPSPIVQGQERRKAMLGVLTAAEKRKSSMF